jgi:hypothetical protein
MANLYIRIMYCVLCFQNQLSLYTVVYCYLIKAYLFNLFWGRFENFKFYPEEIWTGFATLCRKGLRDKLQKLQNRAARIITRSNYEIRSSQILNNLNWPTLEDRPMKQKSCLMFKVFHKLGPSYLSQSFNRANLIHSHGTRGHDYNFVSP